MVKVQVLIIEFETINCITIASIGLWMTGVQGRKTITKDDDNVNLNLNDNWFRFYGLIVQGQGLSEPESHGLTRNSCGSGFRVNG